MTGAQNSMGGTRWLRSSSWAVLLAFACVVIQGQTVKRRGRPDPFLSGASFPLQELVAALKANVPVRRIMGAVDARGVTFYPTSAEEKQLRDAGAPDDLVRLIETKGEKYKPPPPPPPKPKTAGPLTLTCGPAECNVAVDGTPQGQTQGGVKKIASLIVGPQGSVAVDFSKDGYYGQQIVVPLKAGAPASAKAVTLQPTVEMEEKLGGQLFAVLVAKLGGDAGLKDSQMLTGAGSAILYQSGGQRSDWRVASRLNGVTAQAYIEMELPLADLKWRDAIKGSVVRSGGAGKLKNTPVAKEMAQIIQHYRDFPPAALMGRLRAEKLKWVSTSATPEASGPVTLKGTGSSGEYTLTVNSTGMLDRVVYQPAANHGPGVSVQYSDYAAIGQGKAPKSFELRFNEQTPHGITLHFDTLQYAPKLTDKDFRT